MLTSADYDVAGKEFTGLLDCIEEAGLHTEVRPGYEQSILIFIKAPEQLLGNTVYKQRCDQCRAQKSQFEPKF